MSSNANAAVFTHMCVCSRNSSGVANRFFKYLDICDHCIAPDFDEEVTPFRYCCIILRCARNVLPYGRRVVEYFQPNLDGDIRKVYMSEIVEGKRQNRGLRRTVRRRERRVSQRRRHSAYPALLVRQYTNSR